MAVFDSVVFTRCFDAVDHHFEFADDKHISVNAKEIFRRKIFFFLLDCLFVLVYGSILILYPAAFSYRFLINEL